MKKSSLLAGLLFALFALVSASFAEVQVTVEHHDADHTDAGFHFEKVPPPSQNDAATSAAFELISGNGDQAGGELIKLHDGQVPTEEDQPSENCFFGIGTTEGRVLVDLNKPIAIKQVNTYSWHSDSRAPQVYVLYGSDGSATNFDARPENGKAPEACGWKLLARVDTRPKTGQSGGIYGVSISDTTGKLGEYRYLLFDVSPTETDDSYGNTFYSEMDVVDADSTTPGATAAMAPLPFVTNTVDGVCEIAIDTSAAPDLSDWAQHKLAPALAGFFPEIVKILNCDGYVPPKRFTVTIKPMPGVANTSGTRVTASSDWLRGELDKEGVGALIHEEVHVVQLYHQNRRGARHIPDWLIEGIPDYIRWYKYEPQSHGADISRRGLARARYDGMYRISANFLNYVSEKYDTNLVTKVNATMHDGTYSSDIWTKLTGKDLEALNTEWKAALEKELGVVASTTATTNAPAGK
ncbi:MAG TPA: basic secretory protein-like protein [Dongiaceae bacterium]|nr:basic secretory protein-like protein [Dongiaceae bacterium]